MKKSKNKSVHYPKVKRLPRAKGKTLRRPGSPPNKARPAGGKPRSNIKRVSVLRSGDPLPGFEPGRIKSDLAFHPLANAFPLIEGAAFKEFCKRGKKRGYIASRPIIMFEGMILDGRNRARMCEATGLKPTIRQFDPATEGDPIEFVISENMDRRHLTPSQKAMAAANLEKLARGRPRKGATGMSRDEASERMGVSRRSVARGAVVRDQGSAGLQDLVKAGAIPVKLAAEIAANLTPLEQAIVVKGGEAAVLSAAKKIRAEQGEKRRAERTAKIITNSDCSAESLLIGGRKFPIILADCPVKYLMGDTAKSVENKYPTMTLDELVAMADAVDKIAAKDSVLFFWIPETHLFVTGKPILDAWGFEHKSGLVWDKIRQGMGKYSFIQHEHLLICTRGAGLPEPKPANKSRSIFAVPKTGHSVKPQLAYEIIEKMYPQFFRKNGDPLAIELFARALKPNEKPRKGWAVWGNQAPAAESVKAAA